MRDAWVWGTLVTLSVPVLPALPPLWRGDIPGGTGVRAPAGKEAPGWEQRRENLRPSPAPLPRSPRNHRCLPGEVRGCSSACALGTSFQKPPASNSPMWMRWWQPSPHPRHPCHSFSFLTLVPLLTQPQLYTLVTCKKAGICWKLVAQALEELREIGMRSYPS